MEGLLEVWGRIVLRCCLCLLQTRSSVPGQSYTPSLFGVNDVANAKATADVTLNIHIGADNGEGYLEVWWGTVSQRG